MASGRIYGSCTANTEKFNFFCDWTSEINIEGNYSTVSVKTYFSPKSGYSYWDFDTVSSRNTSITIDGSTYSRSKVISTGNDWSNGNPLLITTHSKKVYHDDDGTKSIVISARANGRASDGTTNYGPSSSSSSNGDCVIAATTITLDTIPRAATITAAPNFNDEANPTITYSNPAGTAVASLQACISLTGASSDVPYRDISMTGSSYTFNLTAAERNTLRNATKDSNSRQVKFYVKTVIGSTTYYSNLPATLSIINANPVLTIDAVDTNSATIALTGDAHKYIRNHSNVSATVSAAAAKGATIVSTSGAGTFNKVNQNAFTFKATDSRGNSTTKTFTGTLIPYVDLTVVYKPKISVSGAVSINVWGNYYNGSFGAVNNTLTLQYRYKTSTGSYGSWTSYTPSIIGNEHNTTINFNIPNFNYKSNYVIEIRVSDKLATITPSAYSTNALPVFDWSAADFNFNVPVNIDGDLTVNGTLTYTGGDQVVETGTASMGSNGTWYWRKWSSGRAECYGCRNFGNMGVSTTWGVLYRSEAFNQSLPTGLFLTTPEVIDITYRGSNFGGWIAKHETTTASTTNTGGFILVRPASATISQVYLSFNVIGRWK